MADAASLSQLLEAGDERLLDEVRGCSEPKLLGGLAERWYGDTRPAVRRLLLRYLDECCGLEGHQALVKRAFKLAEKAGDDEAMAHFMAAFDRFTSRKLGKHYAFDSRSRRYVEEFALSYSREVPARAPRDRQGRPTGGRQFSRHTREYLKRRAFRYFRHLGLRDPARYRRAMALALPLYQDGQLQRPEQLLEAWGLLHALFGASPVLDRFPGGIRLAAGRSLKELEPKPMFEDAWWEGFDELLAIFERAGSRTVRGAALAMLRKHHADALAALPVARLLPLLRSPETEVQALAAELLRAAPGLDALLVAGWLELLAIPSPTVLPTICELVRKHVAPERLTLAQCLELACAAAAPAAELGLGWAKAKGVTPGDLPALVRLCLEARTPRVRAHGAGWAVAVLAERLETTPEMVRALLDAKHREVREQALKLMMGKERFKDDTSLWIALAESPWHDVRGELARHLEERARLLAPETVRHVWASVLLGVHRGGRAKRRVVQQLADRIAKTPAEARSLLPLLSVSLRSVRAPERRGALAGLAQAAFREPKLRAAIAASLPELKLFAEGVA